MVRDTCFEPRAVPAAVAGSTWLHEDCSMQGGVLRAAQDVKEPLAGEEEARGTWVELSCCADGHVSQEETPPN